MENFRLKVFRTVADTLSFRRAGEQLRLSQPAVTLQIKALEEELSVRLLDRTGNRVALTDAGRILLKHARVIAEQVTQAQEELAALTGDHAGELKIGASTSIAQYVLPQLLGQFRRQFPRVRVSVVSGNTEVVVQHMISHKIEIGLIEGPALRRDVRTEPFLEDELILVMPATHPFATLPSLSLDQLKGQALLLREHGSGTRRVLETAFEKAGIARRSLNVVMELDSTEAILSSVEAGLGIGFVTRWAVLPRLPLGRIRTAPVKGLRIPRKFLLLYPAGPKPNGSPGNFRQLALDFPYVSPA
ncbi:MAG TPA: LysR substrate-binding domain-containing protein [Candidatus Sulfotelmatobacter sp.]|nr:LysR substrate-binding domain-containing protein [Candidatus Sulfotelmatobacter sp.]